MLTAEKYGNADLAFDFACESVDNRTLKTIFVNLKNCMHYQANYEEVLTQMMGQITESMSAREERKNILFSMKLTLIAISVMSVIIVALIGKGIGVDVKGDPYRKCGRAVYPVYYRDHVSVCNSKGI